MKNIKEIKVPQVGPNDLTVTIIEWNVKEHDFINKGHLICTIETTKSTFDIESDFDIGKVDQNYLYEVLSKIDLNDADALFVSCTALPVLSIIDKLEKKLNKIVLSSNQVLIWDTLEKIGKNDSIKGFGKLFNSN